MMAGVWGDGGTIPTEPGVRLPLATAKGVSKRRPGAS
jgi:hypothetical protein